MDSLKRQAPHFQLSSGHYWILPPFAPLPAGGVEIPDWDLAYQNVLNELFSGQGYHAASAMQQLSSLGIAVNGFGQDAQFVEHVLKQRHLFRLVKARPVSGADGAAPARTLTPLPSSEPRLEGGYATFEPLRPRSDKAASRDGLRFSDLSWNLSQADVDERIECHFQVHNLQAAQEITLIILEQPPGQDARKLTSLNHSVRGSGPQKVLWQPSAMETFGSIGANPPKATGPYHYFFRIEAGPVKSERSPPLTLCRTVILEVTDTDGAPLTDGSRVSLEGADGKIHYATLDNGEARFDGVVIGSAKVAILDRNHRT